MDIHAKKSMDDTKLRQPFIKKQKNLFWKKTCNEKKTKSMDTQNLLTGKLAMKTKNTP